MITFILSAIITFFLGALVLGGIWFVLQGIIIVLGMFFSLFSDDE